VSVEDDEHQGDQAPANRQKMLKKFENSSTKTFAEQSMSSQTPFGSGVWTEKPELWRNHDWLFHYDNEPAHTTLKTTEFLTNNIMVIDPHPPYSPDLVPCDFALFPKLKMKPKRPRFETVSVIQRESPAVLDSIKENDFHGTFEAWKKQWDCCIHSERNYFEDMAAKIKLSRHFFFDLVRELSDSGVNTFSFCCQKCIVHFSEMNLERNE
jgi:hypothetical protein